MPTRCPTRIIGFSTVRKLIQLRISVVTNAAVYEVAGPLRD